MSVRRNNVVVFGVWLGVLVCQAIAFGQKPPGGQSQHRDGYDFRYGGSFKGTLAYDRIAGYDFGQHRDNRGAWLQEERQRREKPRYQDARRREDPGDVDRFDPYFNGWLYNDGRQGQHDDMAGYLGLDEGLGRERYWRTSRHTPLRYDDFRIYRRFRYDLR